MSTAVFTISAAEAQALGQQLLQQLWEVDQIPYTHWRARKNKTTCTAYCSGKLTIQGQDSDRLIEEVITPLIGGVMIESKVKATKETLPTFSDEFVPHIGIDESGKGDFFGPLVTAAAFVDEISAPKLIAIGVQDSKNIKNDRLIASIAAQIKEIIPDQFTIINIGNLRYNELYDEIKNLNNLLAWCHATALENTLIKVPHCQMAIADQFSHNEKTIRNQLKERGKSIKLVQMTKAESDIAVATASILARAEFVRSLHAMSLKLQLPVNLPKGASAAVKAVAAKLYAQGGFEFLKNNAKLHFKTTREIIQGE